MPVGMHTEWEWALGPGRVPRADRCLHAHPNSRSTPSKAVLRRYAMTGNGLTKLPIQGPTENLTDSNRSPYRERNDKSRARCRRWLQESIRWFERSADSRTHQLRAPRAGSPAGIPAELRLPSRRACRSFVPRRGHPCSPRSQRGEFCSRSSSLQDLRSALPGEVADGVERLACCLELGLECARLERRFSNEAEFVHYRLTTNLKRRQLSVGHQIRLGLALEEVERQLAAGRRAQAKGKPRGRKALPVKRPEEKGETRERVAAALGLSAATYARGAKVLREGSPELVVALEEGRESVFGAYRRLKAEQRRAENERLARALREQPPPLPRGCFEVVACDPPWPFASSQLPYPTMSLAEIAALPISRLLAADACLWLWTPNAFLFEAKRIAEEAWGLKVRGVLTWAKDRSGTGTWLRGQTEHCLLATQGKPLVMLSDQSTLLVGPVREHSRKPDEFYALVESLCPGRKLELFARERRPGWRAWGAEPAKFGPSAASEAA